MQAVQYKILFCPKLSLLEEESLLFLYNDIFYLSQWSEKYLKNFLTEQDRKPLVVLLYIDDKICGFALGRLQKNKQKVFLLEALAVKRDYQGKALGGQILKNFSKAAIEHVEAEKIVLHYRDSNKLEEFYAKNGFKHHSIQGTYKNGETKHYMEITRNDIIKTY